MAKSYKNLDTFDCEVGLIIVDPHNNYRSLEGDLMVSQNEAKDNEIAFSLARQGWWHYKRAIIVDATQVEIDAEIARRQAKWDNLKGLAPESKDHHADLVVFEKMYTRNGKLMTPKFSNVTAFRRFTALPVANRFRIQGKARKDDKTEQPVVLEPITEIPVEYRVFARMAEQVEAQMLENGDDTGRLPPTQEETLLGLQRLFEFTESPTKFQGVLNGSWSLAQKYLGILQCNRDFPYLRLLERVTSKPNSPDHIPLKSVKKEVVRKVGNGSEPVDTLTDHIKELTGEKPKADDKPKPIPQDTMKTMGNNAKNLVVRDMMANAAIGNQKAFGFWSETADSWNLHLALLRQYGVDSKTIVAKLMELVPAEHKDIPNPSEYPGKLPPDNIQPQAN